MTQSGQKNSTTVYLVGAGPGDPGLITEKGLGLLKMADVVVHDSLVNPLLLKQVKPNAEVIDVGKRGKNHKAAQEEINRILLEKAAAGLMVVRLKGGDPIIFGRGAEEAAFLAKHAIACEIIPGVTSAIGAATAAGIALTHRKIASTVTFVTGHEDPAKKKTAVDYPALAELISQGGSVCFYMAMTRLEMITKRLVKAGCNAQTPAAAIQWGTWAGQKTVKAKLGKLADATQKARLGSPAIVIIGQTAGLEPMGLEHATTRPLSGVKIINTRTADESDRLTRLLNEAGAEVLAGPTIEIAAMDDWTAVDTAIREIGQYDWLILTSANGVRGLASRLQAMGLDARHLVKPEGNKVQVAAVGEATVSALRDELAIAADAVPQRFTAETLAELLIHEHQIAGRKVLFLKGDLARKTLPRLLTEAGAAVTEAVIYQTRRPESLPNDIVDSLRNGEVDWVTFTSSSTVRNIVALLGDESKLLKRVRVASIGPVTTETVMELGFKVDAEAGRSDMEGLVAAIINSEPHSKRGS